MKFQETKNVAHKVNWISISNYNETAEEPIAIVLFAVSFRGIESWINRNLCFVSYLILEQSNYPAFKKIGKITFILLLIFT